MIGGRWLEILRVVSGIVVGMREGGKRELRNDGNGL